MAHLGDNGFNTEQYFVHHNDIEISKLATELTLDKYQYYRTQKAEHEQERVVNEALREEEEREKLKNEVLHLLLDFRLDYLERRLKELQQDITQAVNEPERMMMLMKEFQEAQKLRNDCARQLGSNIVI